MKNFFTVILSTFRWQDIVDIVLNSYILFRFYVLFRGTTTFRVIVGIVLLWFIQRIASFLGLIVTSWAIQGITAAAALIIIIIFRFEIRSVLQAKNLKSIIWGFPQKTTRTPVEIIAESAFDLARQRHGGLIVLPAKKDLKDIIQQGIPWQGILTREMILTIFWPDNPVHDGAAIVEGNRVSRVGVILPLSSRQDLPSYYGTRHRAAGGLAESSDAMVIVISEERGRVTVARETQFTPVRTPHHLMRLLKEHLGMSQKRAASRKRERLHLAAAAVASFILITGVWFSFSKGFETLVSYEVPIEYANRDPRMQILDTSTDSVNLQLSGSGSLIKSLHPDQISVKIDLGNAVTGRNVFILTRHNISLPPGVVLKQIRPASVEVTLDVPVRKKLPVQVAWDGRLNERLRIEKVRVAPAVVEVEGGSRILENVATVYTEKVPLENIKESGTMTVSLMLQPTLLKTAPGLRDRVTIEFVVKERIP